MAEKVLRTGLLSAEGAAVAVDALEVLGELFAKARLFFARRTSPVSESEMDDAREAWLPPAVLH